MATPLVCLKISPENAKQLSVKTSSAKRSSVSVEGSLTVRWSKKYLSAKSPSLLSVIPRPNLVTENLSLQFLFIFFESVAPSLYLFYWPAVCCQNTYSGQGPGPPRFSRNRRYQRRHRVSWKENKHFWELLSLSRNTLQFAFVTARILDLTTQSR